jgi:hypothetical protein
MWREPGELVSHLKVRGIPLGKWEEERPAVILQCCVVLERVGAFHASVVDNKVAQHHHKG